MLTKDLKEEEDESTKDHTVARRSITTANFQEVLQDEEEHVISSSLLKE
jgi:hypothetical protein